jgi:hypothetical protein
MPGRAAAWGLKLRGAHSAARESRFARAGESGSIGTCDTSNASSL